MVDERALTRSFASLFGKPGRQVTVGIGDDAAVVRNQAQQSVLACDPVVEGVHFESTAPAALIGAKAVNRNLSDLAAMGAVPDYLLVSLLLPGDLTSPRRRSLLRGLRTAADRAGCVIVGGDVARTPGPLTVTVTAVGHLSGRILRRKDARAGDTVHVTGRLGGSALGRHLRFRAATDEGVWLSKCSGIGAVIDVSDGFLLDLHTLLIASGGLGAEIDAEAVPVHPSSRRLARRTGRTPLEHALEDGEDHVLLFTVRKDARLRVPPRFSEVMKEPVGVLSRRPGLRLRRADGGLVKLSPKGFKHDL